MVSSSEISRKNGQKSNGPVTERGKTIASKNAVKHGLLSTKPPLVQGEDFETFQGLMQSLIDEYNPESATEHLLVQQIAMGWLKLHRLWGVEAAIANLAMLKIERDSKFPDAILILAKSSEGRDRRPDLEQLEARIAEAQQQALAIPSDTDKLMRYERHILKALDDALNRLATIQQQRQ